MPPHSFRLATTPPPPPPALGCPACSTHPVLLNVYNLCAPQDPMQSRGGGSRSPAAPSPATGGGCTPTPPSSTAGLRKGGGEEAGRRPVVLRPGVVLLSGLLIAPVSVVLFFFPPLVVLFRAALGSPPEDALFCAPGFVSLSVSLCSPLFTLRTFCLFRFVRPFPPRAPLLILYVSFCTLFQLVPLSLCAPLGFAHPFLSARPSHTPHCSHTPSPYPTPHSHPKLGAHPLTPPQTPQHPTFGGAARSWGGALGARRTPRN